MRVFVTGASGHIGSALVPELLRAGHRVVGLARSEASAGLLEKAGAEVQRGSLDDLDGLRAAAQQADGVVHLAFKHDMAFSGDYAGAVSADRAAIAALGAALQGTEKPFVGTAGTLLLAQHVHGRACTESDLAPAGGRVDAENEVIALASRGVRASVVRLAPTVHSALDRTGFVPTLVALARKNGFSAYVGDGENHWPAVHTRDAANLYRLALERAPFGARLHGVADEGVPFRLIAEAIARGTGVAAKSVSADQAPEVLDFLAAFARADNVASSARTRELLQWRPSHPSLLADLAERHYFEH